MTAHGCVAQAPDLAVFFKLQVQEYGMGLHADHGHKQNQLCFSTPRTKVNMCYRSIKCQCTSITCKVGRIHIQSVLANLEHLCPINRCWLYLPTQFTLCRLCLTNDHPRNWGKGRKEVRVHAGRVKYAWGTLTYALPGDQDGEGFDCNNLKQTDHVLFSAEYRTDFGFLPDIRRSRGTTTFPSSHRNQNNYWVSDTLR